MTKLQAISLCMIALTFAGCTAGSSRQIARGTADAVTSTDTLPAPTETNALVAQPEYRIGPLDQLEISVFEIPDFTRNVRVNAEGQISIPLLGAVDAVGKTTRELEDHIAAELTREYLRSAQVSVFVTDFASQRITVDGAVGAPGQKPIVGRTTLMQLIAMSGGLSEAADPSGVVIFRHVGRERMAGVFDIAAIRSGEHEDPEVYGGDIVIVDYSGARAALRDFRATMPLIGFMGLGL